MRGVGCSAQLGWWSSSQGRAEEGKAVADHLGLDLLMGDGERGCLHGAMAGCAMKTLTSSVVCLRFFKNEVSRSRSSVSLCGAQCP